MRWWLSKAQADPREHAGRNTIGESVRRSGAGAAAGGDRQRAKVLSLQSIPNFDAQHTKQRGVNEQGFSLHAEVRCAMNQRNKLERLCRYITRPAIANERLKLNSTGDVVLRLKSPYQDGTTHIVMSPLGERKPKIQ